MENQFAMTISHYNNKPNQPETFQSKSLGESKFAKTLGFTDIKSTNGDTMIWQVKNFEDDSSTYWTGINDALECAQSSSFDNLIIDVRSNPGGYVCSASRLAYALLGTHFELIFDFIHSNFLTDLINATNRNKDPISGLFVNGNWDNPKTGKPENSSSWYSNSVQYERGGINGNYSQKVGFYGCQSTYDNLITSKFRFKKILIASDGLCGSACAIFTHVLSQDSTVRTLAMGGIESQSKMSYFSFPGGIVINNTDVDSWIKYYNLVSHYIPSFSLPDGGLRFVIPEIYGSLSDTVPLEFIFKPSHFRMHMWLWGKDSDSEFFGKACGYFSEWNTPLFQTWEIVLIVCFSIFFVCCITTLTVVYIIRRKKALRKQNEYQKINE